MCNTGSTLGNVGLGIATGGISTVANAINPANSMPGAPQLPQFPQFSQQEQNILNNLNQSVGQQNTVTQGVGTQLGQNQQILQLVSGLFNPDGSINQNAIANLQQYVQGTNQQAGAAGSTALSALSGNNQALAATQSQYINALNGNVPANQQLQYTTQQNFNQMKEQAAQQGIQINGDNWNAATSNSTAGQKLLQDFQQNANIQNQNYQLGYLGQLSGNMGQIAGAGATQANTGLGLSGYAQQNPLNYLNQSISGGMGALTPYLTSYQSSLGNQFTPYWNQTMGIYGQQTAQQQADYQAALQKVQANQSFLNGIGSIAGTAIGYGMGGGLRSGAMMGQQSAGSQNATAGMAA